MNVIFWDTETNGLEKTNSVLSVSAIKCSFIIKDEGVSSSILERFERYYYRQPGEKPGKRRHSNGAARFGGLYGRQRVFIQDPVFERQV